MRIVHLLAGAGNMYCGSCLHGSTLASALRDAGQDILLVPVYTPLKTDDEDISHPRVAYGGINTYLQQHFAPFRHTPWFFDRFLDSSPLLHWLGRRAGTTRPERLGSMTVSMLLGEEGRQRKELRKLVHWLLHEVQPDLVHLSNGMLVGMARQLSTALKVPVVSSLSGEDVFLEKLPEPYYTQARSVLRSRACDLAGLTAMNDSYAEFMANYLSVSRDRIQVILPGLNLSGHRMRSKVVPSRQTGTPAVEIGFLSRVCPEKGLHQLAEACRILAEEEKLPMIRLSVAGYLAETDLSYLRRIQSQFETWGLANRFRYVGALDRAAKIAFLQSLDVMSIPSQCRESKGLPVLEAWANGVPVVLPDQGAYSELVHDT
ncbi:MAG: glycosyltransferase family 4 protein, partial [Pirellulales bacterium]|nr:glycosyltransferase family 4 protein [Pirellulales bacterium]